MTAPQQPHPPEHCAHECVCGHFIHGWPKDGCDKKNCEHDTRASHSAASQQRIEQVIKELEEKIKFWNAPGLIQAAQREAWREAIALLRGEQHE